MTEGVTQEVFEVVLARSVVGGGGGGEADQDQVLVHVWWRAPGQGERLVQVYVNGVLTEVTTHVEQRELWLMCDRTRTQRIELLAVDAGRSGMVWASHEGALDCWEPAVVGSAKMAVVRDEKLPADTRLIVEVDGREGDRGLMWPAGEHRGGFGGLFGLGEFGLDAVTGPGLGQGELGLGALGVDGTAWRWRSDDLAAGTHELKVKARDKRGVEVAGAVTVDGVVIEALPRAVAGFEVGGDFTLRWSQ